MPRPKLHRVKFTSSDKNANSLRDSLNIEHFQDHYPYSKNNLVVLRDNGLMTYPVKSSVITVHGCMSQLSEERFAGLCGIKEFVSLAFNDSAHQMAIQNANAANEALFNYLATPVD